jgi:hypothetical protein
MKKTLLSVAIAIAALSASAQNTENEQSFKPSAGSVVTELNFNPFKGNLSLNNSLNQVKLRYFTSESVALRLGFHLSNIDSVANTGTPYGTQSNFSRDERKSTTFALNFGVEKHFAGTSRLSPYIGVDATVGIRSASQETANNQNTTTLKNGWVEYYYNPQPPQYSSLLINQAYSRFGITAVAGFDFYMAKNFFLGYEFNLNYMRTSYKIPEVTVSNGGQQTPVIEGKNTSASFGTSLMNGIRIGYAF